MDLEVSLIERLQKLRQWQIEQQERLIKQQQEQRQQLTQEQLRMYEALRLPIQEIGFDNKTLCESSWYENGYLSANKTDHTDNCRQEQNDKDTKKVIQEQTLNDNNDINKSDYIPVFINSNTSTINESFLEEKSLTKLKKSSNGVCKQSLSKLKYQVEDDEDNAKNDCNSNNENIYITSQKKKIHLIDHLLEGIEPLPPDKSVDRNFLIDDIPVPFSKKDFKTLLEEKLKEHKSIFNKESNDKMQNQVKRPFLKKGQGLARFRMIQTPRNIPLNVKSCTIPISIKQINPTNNKNDDVKNKNNSKLSKNVPSKKCITTINVAQQQLNLKNVPPPKKTYSEKNEAVLANIESNINSNIIEINNSDIDLKTQREMEEIRIFELLEEKAENSSLCSTSSTVVAFLQQSTPFKIRQKIQDTEDNINNPIQQDIIHKDNPRRLQLTDTQPISSNQKTESDVNSCWETIPIKNPNETLENKLILKNQNIFNISLKNKKSDQMFIQNHIKHVHDETNCDIQNSICSNEVDVGLHVRFSEYNEYKTINLTDNSSICSSESLSQKDYNDERAWSDCSELSDSSDTNVQLIKCQTFKTNEVANETCGFTNTCTNQIMKEEVDQHEIKETQETIFKSELLKNRLLELEKEIDIFRKENAALSSQRQKLQEDYRCFLKEIKEKELILEDNKKRIDRLEEEKRKLIREKAVLESRLRDSQEKAHQNKLERQQIQDLKEQLEKLQVELRSKESKWNAAQARHRSQMRILKMENIKLKEEVERLTKTKSYNPKTTKRIGTYSNTKALHQLNKQLSEETKEVIKNDSSLEDDDKMSKTMLDAINSEHKYIKSDYEVNSLSNEDHNHNSNRSNNTNIPKEYEQCMLNIIKKRNLYENLLKDATSNSIEVSNVIKASELNKLRCEANGTRKNQNKKENENSKSQIDKDTCMDEIDKVTLNYEDDNDIVRASQKLPLASISPKELLHTYKRTISPKEFKTNEQVQCIEHPNGCTELWYPNGNVKKIFPNKGMTKMLYYNGDVRETQKDGKVKYFYASTRTWHTTMPDGLEILEFPK